MTPPISLAYAALLLAACHRPRAALVPTRPASSPTESPPANAVRIDKLDTLLNGVPDAEQSSSLIPDGEDGAIREVLRRTRAQVHLCFENENAAHPTRAGEVDVSYTIETSGRVTRAGVNGLNSPLDHCIERVFVGLKFPPRPSSIRVIYPYVFGAPPCSAAVEAFDSAATSHPRPQDVLAAARRLVLAAHNAPSCRPMVETRVRELAFGWLLEDHHHALLPAVRELLELHAGEFPNATSAGLVQYRLGTVIATLAQCGCTGHQHDPTEWQQASAAFGRAAASGAVETVDWQQTRVPLVQSARRGEVICLAAATDPFVATAAERAETAGAIAAYLSKTTDRAQRGDLQPRQEILEMAADSSATSFDRLTALVNNEQIAFDLRIVAVELLVRRLANLVVPSIERTTRASGLRRSAVVAQYAESEPTLARCLAELEAPRAAPACSHERQGRWRWSDAADIRR